MSVFVDDMLQSEGLMDSAKLWTIACLGWRAQLLFLSIGDQSMRQNASIEPADGLANSYWPVVGCVCGIPLLEDGRDQR